MKRIILIIVLWLLAIVVQAAFQAEGQGSRVQDSGWQGDTDGPDLTEPMFTVPHITWLDADAVKKFTDAPSTDAPASDPFSLQPPASSLSLYDWPKQLLTLASELPSGFIWFAIATGIMVVICMIWTAWKIAAEKYYDEAWNDASDNNVRRGIANLKRREELGMDEPLTSQGAYRHKAERERMFNELLDGTFEPATAVENQEVAA